MPWLVAVLALGTLSAGCTKGDPAGPTARPRRRPRPCRPGGRPRCPRPSATHGPARSPEPRGVPHPMPRGRREAPQPSAPPTPRCRRVGTSPEGSSPACEPDSPPQTCARFPRIGGKTRAGTRTTPRPGGPGPGGRRRGSRSGRSRSRGRGRTGPRPARPAPGPAGIARPPGPPRRGLGLALARLQVPLGRPQVRRGVVPAVHRGQGVEVELEARRRVVRRRAPAGLEIDDLDAPLPLVHGVDPSPHQPPVRHQSERPLHCQGAQLPVRRGEEGGPEPGHPTLFRRGRGVLSNPSSEPWPEACRSIQPWSRLPMRAAGLPWRGRGSTTVQ